MQYGVLAGLTVHAVPQVLAATAPVGVLAVTASLVALAASSLGLIRVLGIA